jgi:hypothetical protein
MAVHAWETLVDTDDARSRAAVLELVRRMGGLSTSWGQVALVAGDDLARLARELDRLAAGARSLHGRLALGPVTRVVLRPEDLNPPTD